MALRFFMFHAATNEPRLSLTPRPCHRFHISASGGSARMQRLAMGLADSFTWEIASEKPIRRVRQGWVWHGVDVAICARGACYANPCQ